MKLAAQGAGGAEGGVDGAGHAGEDLGDDGGDVEDALDLGLEVGDLLRGLGVLQVVEGAAVGDGGDQSAELQRGHGDALAEGAHAADAALGGGKFVVGILAELLALDVVAGELAEAELLA